MNFTSFLGPSVAGLGGIAGSVIQGIYQKGLQDDQQEFAKEQSQNQIKYNVQQMKDLKLSPLMLFDHGNATGGGAGAGGQGSAPNFANAIIAMSNQIRDILKEDAKNDLAERRIDLQEAKENRLENNDIYMNDYFKNKGEQHRTQAKLNNQIYDIRNKNNNSFNNRKYTNKEFNDVYDDINTVEL